MAVSVDCDQLGRATTDVTVRDPVDADGRRCRASAQRRPRHHEASISTTRGAAWRRTPSRQESGPVKVTGQSATTVKLTAKQRTSMSLALDAGGAGTAQLDVDISGPNGLALARHYASTSGGDADPRAALNPTWPRRESDPDVGHVLDLVQGTGGVSLSVSLSTALDAATFASAGPVSHAGRSRSPARHAAAVCHDLAAGRPPRMDTEVDQRIKMPSIGGGPARLEWIIWAMVGGAMTLAGSYSRTS